MTPLRLAIYSNQAWPFDVVRRWAAGAGHEIALLVTVPERSDSETGHLGAMGVGASEVPVAVVRRVVDAADRIASTAPDLGVIFSFNKLPDDIAGIPPCGTVNLHPALLPAHRGPNVFRAIFEGDRVIGSTLHRIVNELDAGPILAQAACEVPDDVRPETVLGPWEETMMEVLRVGVPMAAAGAPGQPQDVTGSTYAANFGLRDLVLDLALPLRTLQGRATALLLAGQTPLVRLGGRSHRVRSLETHEGPPTTPPRLLSLTPDRARVAVPGGVVEVELDGSAHP